MFTWLALNFGTPVYEMPTTDKSAMDAWIAKISEHSGQSLAWRDEGARFFSIFALGDLSKVRKAIRELQDENPAVLAWTGPKDQLRNVFTGDFVVCQTMFVIF